MLSTTLILKLNTPKKIHEFKMIDILKQIRNVYQLSRKKKKINKFVKCSLTLQDDYKQSWNAFFVGTRLIGSSK